MNDEDGLLRAQALFESIDDVDNRFTTALAILMLAISTLPESRQTIAVAYTMKQVGMLQENEFDLQETTDAIEMSMDTKTDLPKKDQFH